MSTELSGPAGTLRLDADGTCTVRRGTAVVLCLQRAFIEFYGVSFSVRGVRDIRLDGSTLHACFETGRSELVLTLEARADADGFRLDWSAPSFASRVGLEFSLALGGPWYGMGERVVQSWPLSQLGGVSEPFAPIDHGRDGTLSIGTPLWLNRAGAGLLVEEDTGELAVLVNADRDGFLRIAQRARERIPMTIDELVESQPPRLALRVLLADSLPAVQRRAVDHLGKPATAPPLELFVRPIWTTWARYKMHITQAQALEFADEIVAQGFPRSVFEIDDRWQSAYGELCFDQVKFPDPAALVEQLHARGFRVTLWVPPFFERTSAAFREAAEHGHLLRHIATNEPALTRWWQGYGGLLDVSSPAAMDWWLARLRRLQTDYGIDGFKFDAGEGNFVPHEARSAGDLTPTNYADKYVEFVARHFEWTEVRCGWRAQRQGVFFREWDKWSRWGLDNGLHSVLTGALTLGLIGYPFVLPDMIGGNAYDNELPDDELMVRWMQLTALLPAMQFSLCPWDYGREVTAICLRYTQLHERLGPLLETCAAEAVADGTPMVRPLFWHAPDDAETYAIDDQFTLGDSLLVAPVLTPGARARSVYLPRGVWRDYWNGAEHRGPVRLDAYPAPLDTLPLFERMNQEP
jgi:alpha-glucosidase (family GH31 glycosyl hydrolase)